MSARDDFYARLSMQEMAPLWVVLKNLVPKEPVSKAKAHKWAYEVARPLLIEAAGIVTAEEAERRVLVLENPNFRGQSRTTTTMYAGLQLIMPGETAPAHRHTPSALRFMIEGKYGFTSVGGERTSMREGDLVITPSWAWHDHGNEGDGPVIWLDGLDIPIVQYFETIFSEHHTADRQELSKPEDFSLNRFGSGLAPMEPEKPYGYTSPIFNYPYERSRAALMQVASGAAPDPHWATTLRYVNPNDGQWAMPTMATWLTHVKAGEKTTPIRTTDGIVCHIAEGSGSIQIGDETVSYKAKDTIAIPGWAWRSFKPSTDTIFFNFSDRVVHEKLGLYREEKQKPN